LDNRVNGAAAAFPTIQQSNHPTIHLSISCGRAR
jgi:hypothetical protein